MDIEELVAIYKKEKYWISGRLSTIDSLLDRAAYGNSDDEQELNEEYDELEKRLGELRQVADLIGKVNELNRLTSLMEGNIENLACFTGNEMKIKNLQAEIEELEGKKEELLSEIKNILKVDEQTPKNINKK